MIGAHLSDLTVGIEVDAKQAIPPFRGGRYNVTPCCVYCKKNRQQEKVNLTNKGL